MKTLKMLVCFLSLLSFTEISLAQEENSRAQRDAETRILTTQGFTKLNSNISKGTINHLNNHNLNYTSVMTDTIQETNIREFYLSLNIGYPSILDLGFGYQHSNEWSFTSKVSLLTKNNDAFSVIGIGIGTARFFSTPLIFNNIYILPTFMLFRKEANSYQFGLNGFSFEIGIGNESIEASGINVFWSLGGVIYIAKYYKPEYYPILKLGLGWNF